MDSYKQIYKQCLFENEYFTLSDNDFSLLCSWVKSYLNPRATINNRYSSYGLKHIAEKCMPSKYVSNADLKAAMLACGFKAEDTGKINWCFNISEKSPALKF